MPETSDLIRKKKLYNMGQIDREKRNDRTEEVPLKRTDIVQD